MFVYCVGEVLFWGSFAALKVWESYVNKTKICTVAKVLVWGLIKDFN
jgi:hypothetical protein